jgi:hypothetical protein
VLLKELVHDCGTLAQDGPISWLASAKLIVSLAWTSPSATAWSPGAAAAHLGTVTRVPVFGVPLNNGALRLNATPVMEPSAEGRSGARPTRLCEAAGVPIRIWIHRTRPLVRTAATGQSGRKLDAGPDHADS